jgi:hypothetical protein
MILVRAYNFLKKQLSPSLFKEEMTYNSYAAAFYSTYNENKKLIFKEEFAELKYDKSSIYSRLWRFQLLEKRIIPEAAIAILEDAKVISSSGMIVSKEKVFISDFSRKFGVPILNRKLKSWNFKRIEHRYFKVAVVTTEGSNTYYHWLFDILPRIFLLEKSGLMDEIEIFVFPELKYDFQRESLFKIGFPLDKILEIKPNEYLEAKEMIVPSLPSKLGTVNKWSLDFLSSRLGEHSSKKDSNRIYISRKNANQRKLLNEDEIINFLKSEGYLIVLAENLSLDQQITLFANADVVISPHGSGLSNITFCPPGTKVIELFYGNFIVSCFWLIAQQLELEYYCGFSRSPENLTTPYWKSKESDDKFSIEILIQLLKEAKIKK